MPKEIRDYQESIFFGLSTRQFLCSLLAVGVAVGIYFGLRPFVGSEEVGWMCILGAAPFAACGFFKYHGMTAEKLAWAWFKSEFLYPKKLVFQSDSLYYEAMEEAIAEGEKLPTSAKAAGPATSWERTGGIRNGDEHPLHPPGGNRRHGRA